MGSFQGIFPVEQLPDRVDGVPAVLRLIHASHAEEREQYRKISWEEFFLKFDSLGLVCVYDESEDSTGDNVILHPRTKDIYSDKKDLTPDPSN